MKSETLIVTVELGGTRVEFKAEIDVDHEGGEPARVRRVMGASVEMGFSLLDVGAERSEHRV
jgi:hypothetical protein